MTTEPCELTVLPAKKKGKPTKIAPPVELPSDLTPGEFLFLPDSQGKPQWYVFCDKQRWWGNDKWNLTGTIHAFDPGKLTEKEVYKLRRSLLKQCGWIA